MTLVLKAAIALCALAMLWSASPAAQGEDQAALYEADAIVTGTDMRQRPWGFARCLSEVLVKVSGNPRLKDDPRTAELAAHAERYIASFEYVDMMAGIKKHDDQGSYDRPHQLSVRFDPAKIDGVLAELGESPWRGIRPEVVPVLLVRGPKPPAYVLSTDSPAGAEQRGAFVEAALEFGMTVRLPSDAELAAWGVTTEHFPVLDAPEVDKSPQKTAVIGAQGVVVFGTLEWSETLPGWTGAWRIRWRGADHRWGVKGVNYDAAFRDIVAGVMRLASGHGAPE